MSKLNAAVVGLGIGHAHCAAYLQSPHARLAAVCDPWPQRLARVGGTFEQGSMLGLKSLYPKELLSRRWEELGVRTCTSLEELLQDPSIEIVSLCTPDHTHEELAVRVLQAHRHLLLEKPLALSLAGAERIGKALAGCEKTFGIGYEFRLNPAIVKVRSLLDEGFAGEVQAFSLHHFRTPFRHDKWKSWIQKRECSGGLIVEETCHWLDLARFLTGREIEEACCRTTDRILPDFDFEDIAYIDGRFNDGAIFQIAHALTGFDFSLTLSLHGRRGTIWCALKEEEKSLLDGGQTGYCGIVAWGEPNRPRSEASFVTFGLEATEPCNIRDLAGRFAACAASGQKPPAGFDEGCKSLEAALLCRQAAELGRPLAVRDLTREEEKP